VSQWMINLIFVSNSKNLKNNGKYWITEISSEILCTGSSGSIGWALSLSLGSKTIEPEAPKVLSSRAQAQPELMDNIIYIIDAEEF
jgi:hypothetical protein